MAGGFSFVHAADLHLASPFRGLAGAGAPEHVLKCLRESTFRAFDNVIKLCLEQGADFLLLAGDIFDAADRSLRAQLKLRDGLQRLAGAGVPTFAVHGNHDHCAGWRAGLNWPENVFFFPPGEVQHRPVLREGREIARVYGTSYAAGAVTENLAAGFTRADGAPFGIALLHCNVDGLGGHDNYAPCRLDDLLGRGFDYWALGHIHARRILCESGPLVVYPGCTQGRSPAETGARGCYLVTVDKEGRANAEFRPTDAVRWVKIGVSISGLVTEEELVGRLEEEFARARAEAGSRSLVARLELTGRGPLHTGLARSRDDLLHRLQEEHAGEAGGSFLWPAYLHDLTGPDVNREELLRGDNLLGDLLTLAREARREGEVKSRLLSALTGLTGHPGAGRYLDVPAGEEWDLLLQIAEDLALDLLDGGDGP